jgi:hypothetical protein
MLAEFQSRSTERKAKILPATFLYVDCIVIEAIVMELHSNMVNREDGHVVLLLIANKYINK